MALASLSNTAARFVEGVQSALGMPPDHQKSIKKNIRIKSLFVHPIKSCRGSSVPEAYFDDGGLRYDRSWLIIDAQSRKFQTARDLPRMVTIAPQMDLTNNVLTINIPLREKGKGDVVVKTPLDPSVEELASMEVVDDILIWVHKVNGYAVSKEADEALSEFFGKSVRLVRKGPSVRPSGPDDPRGQDSAMHFQDFYPFLVASSASLQNVQDTLLASVYPGMAGQDPQQRKDGREGGDGPPREDEGGRGPVKSYKVSDKVPLEYWTPEQLKNLGIERFRPNVLVESFADDGGKNAELALEPWEEDGWSHIEVFDGRAAAAAGDEQDGGVAWGHAADGKGTGIDCVVRCGRCMVPNIDPEQGMRDSFLPYTVLQRFRQVQPELKALGKPCFGMLSAPAAKSGVLRVGDIVRVTATTDPNSRGMKKP